MPSKSAVILRWFVVFSVFVMFVSAKPTIYMKNDNDKLEPVLVPVSSTVIPLPVYKVGYGVSLRTNSRADEPPGPGSTVYLITAHHKKKATATTKSKSTSTKDDSKDQTPKEETTEKATTQR